MGNFVGEFLVLLGSFDANPPLTIVAAAGLVAAVIYALTLVQRAFHGELRRSSSAPDLCLREMAVMAVMMILILWLGVRPQPLLDTVSPALLNLQKLDASHAALTEHQP